MAQRYGINQTFYLCKNIHGKEDSETNKEFYKLLKVGRE